MHIIIQFVHYAVDLTSDSEVVSGRDTRIEVTIWLFFFLYFLSIKITFK